MRKLLAVICLASATPALAQHKVTFRVEAPAGQPADSLFLAGSFNGWNPGREAQRLQRTADGAYSLTLDLKPGAYEYKLTRGTWGRVETAAGGADLGNRSLQVSSDTVVALQVAGWKDQFANAPRRSTALPTVQIVRTDFPIPQLNRTRRVWVCLPKNYEKGGRYPVLYMHDGQNLFDDTTGFSGEWGVDEAMDTLERRVGGVIIVGVDHGGATRINEYCPYDMDRFGKGEGAQYVDFLVQTLKPWVDAQYRTRRGPADTYIAGSSMGGLISMYAILKYPKVYGGAGVFSPAFWVAPDLKRDVLRLGSELRGRVFFYAGEQESTEMVPDMLRIFQLLRQLSRAPMQTVIRAEGKHTEAAWRKEFPNFVEWVMKKPPARPMPKF